MSIQAMEASLPRPACGERSDRIADVIWVRGYRSIDRAPLGREPLTPTLSPQERGEGGDSAAYRSFMSVAASSSLIACAALVTLIVVMPISRAGFRLTPRSSR